MVRMVCRTRKRSRKGCSAVFCYGHHRLKDWCKKGYLDIIIPALRLLVMDDGMMGAGGLCRPTLTRVVCSDMNVVVTDSKRNPNPR